MDHGSLCEQAVKWLRRPESQNGPGCIVAVSECTGMYSGEIADAIGFRSVGESQHSVVVEVKVSRSDFLADARKPHRNGETLGMGMFRYYMAPAGLIAQEELPARWGLIEVTGQGLKVRLGHVLEPRNRDLEWQKDTAGWAHDHDRTRETALLVRLLARVGDAELFQQRMKAANNRLAYAQKVIDTKQAELSRALSQYWEIRRMYEEATGQ